MVLEVGLGRVRLTAVAPRILKNLERTLLYRGGRRSGGGRSGV